MIMLMSMAIFLNLKKGTTQALGSAILEQVDRNIDGGEFDKECIAGEYAELQFEKEKSEMNSVSSDPKIEEEILKAEEKLQFPDNEPLIVRDVNRRLMLDIDCGGLCKMRCSAHSRPN
ncbi:hypothetical protein AAZX31_06G221300 [Glycine max]